MDDNTMADASVRAPALASRRTWRIKWRYASPIILVHLIALNACLPWLFSWTGVLLAALG